MDCECCKKHGLLERIKPSRHSVALFFYFISTTPAFAQTGWSWPIIFNMVGAAVLMAMANKSL